MARDRQFKARDKKTQRMTKDGLVEVNQTTGEEARISQRGQDFQLRRDTGAETAPLREPPTGRSRAQPTHRQAQAFMVDDTSADQRMDAPFGADFDAPNYDQQYDISTSSADYDSPPTDSLPRQSGDTPVTSSPGYASAPTAAHTDSGAHPFHTEGGRLREDAHHPDADVSAHRQSGSRYYQQFQEAPQNSAPEQHSVEPVVFSQTEQPAANTETTVPAPPHPDSLAEPTAPMRSGEDLPLTHHPAQSVRDVPDNGAVSVETEAAPPVSERPGRLRFDAAATPAAAGKQRRNSSAYARKFAQSIQPASQTDTPDSTPANTPLPEDGAPAPGEKPPIRDGSAAPAPDSGTAPPSDKKSSRLQFGEEELPPEGTLERKIKKTQDKVGKTDAKLQKAKDALPTKRKLRTERTFDTEKGKPQRKLTFEREAKSQREHLKGPLPMRPIKAGANAAIGFAHGKISQVEQENVGVEAGHKGELIAESAVRRAYRLHKTAPYRRVERLSHLSAKRHVKLTYQEALRDNLPDGLRPKLRSNMVSRFIQKRKIKRQYAKAARDAKYAAQAAKKTGAAAVSGAKAIVGFASQHPVAFGVVALILLLVLIIMCTFGSCSNMAGGVLSAVLSGSYVAEDQDIDNSELSYTDWETDLQMQIDNAETDHPGYDEYRYYLDEIGHDPYELLAYLTAKYQDYTFAEVQAELREIFAEQYTLEFVEEVEIRTYTDEDGDEHEYEWYILNTNLTTKPLTDILIPRMDEEQLNIFDTLMTSKGNRQYSISPFAFDWLPNITCNYGWRVHPISGERDFHNAVDIGVPEGTPILAGHDGRVVTASYDADGYGWYITLEGDKGLATRYAHCSALLATVGQEVKKGEIIAKSGNTGNSTGPHLHFEVRMNGQTLNPLFFAVTEGADSAE